MREPDAQDDAAGLHERVAKQEMVRHLLLNEDGSVQRTEFADGTAVTIRLTDGSYAIEKV